MKKNMPKRFLSLLLVFLMTLTLFVPAQAAQQENVSWQGQWIWTADSPSEAQWINLRKTFTLNEVPEIVEAKVSVDSRYWMWVNGNLAVYEGQLKTGPSASSWYYDCEDIAQYLVEGENTIAVLACYWGRNSSSTVKTGKQGFLFDAEFPAGALADGSTRLVSDTSWKVQRDPAFEAPDYHPNSRVGDVNTKYNAAKAVEGWQNPGFDDSAWANATIKTMAATDPRNTLAERPIPQFKVEEITKYGEEDWNVTVDASASFGALTLPEEYVVTATVSSLNGYNIGMAVCMGDENNFYMTELQKGTDGLFIKPQSRVAGKWSTLKSSGFTYVPGGTLKDKQEVKVEVNADTLVTYINGTQAETIEKTALESAGNSVGLRVSAAQQTILYAMKITDKSGNLIWEDNISEAQVGDSVTMFRDQTGAGTVEYREDANGDTYLFMNNAIVVAGDISGQWKQLQLPETYSVIGTVRSIKGNMGPAVCLTDKNHFYMAQLNFKTSGTTMTVGSKPHLRNNAWKYPTLTGSSVNVDVSGGDKFTVRMDVDKTTVTIYINDTLLGSFTDTTLARKGASVGFRQSGAEYAAVYELQVLDASGKVLWTDDISETAVGAMPSLFQRIDGAGVMEVQLDDNGEKFLHLNNGIVAAGEKVADTTKTYSFKNPTNMQGTPYLKVRSENGGEVIAVSSDSTSHAGGESVCHWYVTKAGEQEWEPYGWMNGWQIDFEMPSSVEVLELGWRKSGYATEQGGTASTGNDSLNQLYQEAYDTLLVTMRDSYMDCPDRERCQWWGDAVNEMQQAAYALDHEARLLYKKTLTQAVGWAEGRGGRLSTVVATPNFNELPVQCLAGVHSLWQYYLYYGETDILETCYDAFMDYLKLWSISDSGFLGHHDGTCDWIDWGKYEDTAVTETAWYYTALESMHNVAQLLGKEQADLDFLQGRMTLIRDNFESLYWSEDLGAYYSHTTNGKPDDRGNAMAVYAGLANPAHYADMLKVFQTVENASPYMEKYVLEAMYLMGYDEAAVTRSLKRFDGMLKDGYPTLYEYWLPSQLSGNGGTGSRNHAWSGAVLSMMYLYNAGITPTGAGFETFRVRPQIGGMSHAEATTDTVSGTISVKATADTLTVTVPEGSTSAEICVPRAANTASTIRLGNATVYAEGVSAVVLPEGVTYTGEDPDYVCFTVVPGTYTFTVAADGTPAPAASYEPSADKPLLKIQDGTDMLYAFRVFVNGEEVEMPYSHDEMDPLPYLDVFEAGETVTVSVKPVDPMNYEVWFNEGGDTVELTMDSDVLLTVGAKEKDCVDTLSISSVTVNNLLTNNSWPKNSVIDGQRICMDNARGYSSNGFTSPDISASPVVLTLDLGTVKTINQVSLFPRCDFSALTGGARSFPTDFTIAVSEDGSDYETVMTVVDHPNPGFHQVVCGFETTQARYVQITVTGLDGALYNESVHPRWRLQLAEVEVAHNSELEESQQTPPSVLVDEQIAAIGEVTLDSKTAIEAARAAYEALDDEQKAKVTQLAVLEAAEAAYAALVQAQADKAAAANAESLIAAIGKVTAESGEKIEAARTAYDALTENQKVLVTNLAVLDAAEQTYTIITTEVSLILTGADKINAYEKEVVYTLSAKDMNHLATLLLTFDVTEEYLSEPVITTAGDWYILAESWKDGKLSVVVCHNDSVDGEGDILSIAFKPMGQAGEASVAITTAQLGAYLDGRETFVPVNTENTSVTTIMECSVYDVNKDGVVNLLDMTRAQRYYGSFHPDADVNDDNKVDIDDLILIFNNYSGLVD